MTTQRSSLNRDYERDYNPENDRRRTTRRSDPVSADREISLGTGTILGIFFALAITCGVFFGFGYQMGRKASQSALAAAADTIPADPNASAAAASNSSQSSSKPSANNPFQAAQALFKKDQAARPASDEATDTAVTDTTSADTPAAGKSSRVPTTVESPSEHIKPGQTSASPAHTLTAQPALVRASTPALASSPAVAQPVAMPQPAAATATGTFVVQVAAVSHQEDAELLDSALKQRGYAVFVRQEPQDHLLHVQVGPFATRRDADTVRQHLLADGYNALLK